MAGATLTGLAVSGSDEDTIGEIVEGVTDQDQVAAGAGFLVIMSVVMGVAIAFVMVAVPDQQGLLEQEEDDEATEQQPADIVGIDQR